MNELVINRTPELIAAEINNIKNQTRKIVIYNSIEIGRRLTEAKQLVGHGAWGSWLEKSVEYSNSTANNLMNIFKEYGNDQMSLLEENTIKSPVYEKLSYSQAMELIKIPEEERITFIEENKVEDMSTRELKKAIEDLNKSEKEKEKAIKDLEKFKKANEKIKKDIDSSNKVNIALEKEIEKIRAELKEPKNNTELEELKKIITENEAKIKELEEKPIEVTGHSEPSEEDIAEKKALLEEVEKVKKEKEEVETKLAIEKEELKKRLDGLISEKKVAEEESKRDIEFKVYFDSTQEAFEKLLNNIDEYPEESQEEKKDKVKKLLNIMLDNI